MYTRRSFLSTGVRTSSAIAGLSAIGTFSRALRADSPSIPEAALSIQDPHLKELVQRGLDSARQTGAEYADVRLTLTRERRFYPIGSGDELLGVKQESAYIHASVRALVNGYWGFAASPIWHMDELTRLGREATQQAKINTGYRPREVRFPPISGERQGHWETPVRIDAFTVHPQEIREYLAGLQLQTRNEVAKLKPFGISDQSITTFAQCNLWMQEKAFGSTEGSYCTQRLHRIEGQVKVGTAARPEERIIGSDDGLLTLTGGGWEVFVDTPILDSVRRMLLESVEMNKLPIKPLDVGRYHTVFDASSMANLVSPTIGDATELDRALAYEANADGTSYLSDPDNMLGTFALGSPQLTITANRSQARGLATTRWDDEGVLPNDITLVENGTLMNFQTSREGAGWLRDTSVRLNRPVRSDGYLAAETAFEAPLIRTGNLVMHPGRESLNQRDIEASVSKGIVVTNAQVATDFQRTGGTASSLVCYELRNGKRVARFLGAAILFRTSEIWKNLMQIGGTASARSYGLRSVKGEPSQNGFHTATAVPALIANLSFIDPKRR